MSIDLFSVSRRSMRRVTVADLYCEKSMAYSCWRRQQQRVDAGVGLPPRRRIFRPAGRGPRQRGDRVGDLFRREHLVHRAGGNRAEGHAVELRRLGTLAEDEAPGPADVLDAPRPVAAGARQDDGDRAVPHVLRQRAEEMIDRQRQAVPRIAVAQEQPALLDDHLLHRRKEIEHVGLDQGFVLGLPDRHRGPPPEELVHQALEIGRQVLQDDEGHPGIGREPREEPLE